MKHSTQYIEEVNSFYNKITQKSKIIARRKSICQKLVDLRKIASEQKRTRLIETEYERIKSSYTQNGSKSNDRDQRILTPHQKPEIKDKALFQNVPLWLVQYLSNELDAAFSCQAQTKDPLNLSIQIRTEKNLFQKPQTVCASGISMPLTEVEFFQPLYTRPQSEH